MDNSLPSGYTTTKNGSILVPLSTAQDLSDIQHPTAWLKDAWIGRRSTAGIAVSPTAALSLSAYFACLRNISEDVGKLPLLTYRQQDRGKELAKNHPLFAILYLQANDYMSAMTFRETLTHHAMGWGNGYAEIVRDGDGTPTELYPIHPSRVRITNTEEFGVMYNVYIASTFSGGMIPHESAIAIPAANMLHIRGLGAEGLYGYSIAELAAESLGLSLSAEMFGTSFFANGLSSSGVLEYAGELSEEAQKKLRISFTETYSGPANTGKPLILEDGMTWKAMGIPPEQAQFLATRVFQVQEIARWFRMPPHKIQDLSEATYSNIEYQNIEYVTDTLAPWLVRWEQEIKRKLFGLDSPYYAKHVVQSLLRGDHQARAKFYETMFKIAALNANEIRELEDMNPIGDDGDEYFVQANNLRPLKQVIALGMAPAVPTVPAVAPIPNSPTRPAPPAPPRQEVVERNGHAMPESTMVSPVQKIRHIIRDDKGLIVQIVDEPLGREVSHGE